MNRITRQLVACVAIAAAGLVNAQETEEPVAVKTQGLPPHVAKGVEAQAAKGITALRRYVERTRGIYNLHLGSLVATPEEAKAMKAKAAQQEIQLAKDEPVPKSK